MCGMAQSGLYDAAAAESVWGAGGRSADVLELVKNSQACQEVRSRLGRPGALMMAAWAGPHAVQQSCANDRGLT